MKALLATTCIVVIGAATYLVSTNMTDRAADADAKAKAEWQQERIDQCNSFYFDQRNSDAIKKYALMRFDCDRLDRPTPRPS
jgi:hypothetical protein